MKYEIRFTSRSKKDHKPAQKRSLKIEELHRVIELLAKGETLPERYRDHPLTGNYLGARVCHVHPD